MRLQERSGEFSPRSTLDLGSGPGTASWAAADAWSSMESIIQVDSNLPLLRLGKMLSDSASVPALKGAKQEQRNLAHGLDAGLGADLVVCSYVLAEVDSTRFAYMLLDTWKRCSGALVLVEPGTTAGYRRILASRDLLLTQHGRVVALCPHEIKCPLAAGDWCHFAQRLPTGWPLR